MGGQAEQQARPRDRATNGELEGCQLVRCPSTKVVATQAKKVAAKGEKPDQGSKKKTAPPVSEEGEGQGSDSEDSEDADENVADDKGKRPKHN